MADYNRADDLVSQTLRPAPAKTSRRERAHQLALDYRIDELERLVDNDFPTLELAPFIAELSALTAARR